MDAGAAIGIDIGSFKTVLAAVKKRGIEIVLSDSSGKSTPTLAAYTDSERLIGDSGMNQMKKNFQNTLQFFPRFLGLNTDCVEQLKEEEQFVTYKVVPLENKKVGFQIKVRGQDHIFTPEQILAYYFRSTKKFFEADNIQSKDIVVSVPSYYSNVERQAVLDALEIAHLKPLRLINESTAISLTYGFFRKTDLPEKDPRYVAFVDLGHSKLTVTITSFLQGKMRIVSHHSDRNLGARNMDTLILDKIGGEFAKKYGADPRTNVRTRLRILDIIEKQRKILSANLEATIHLEALMNDEDLHRNIKRTEFEELIQPLVDKFCIVVKEAIALSGLPREAIHSVEMIGEATRIQIIQEKCKEIFGVDTVSRTLNSLEAVARGCSLQAAMLSPLFKVADYEIQEFNALPVSITYQFNAGGEGSKTVTKDLFPVGCSFPSTKTITFDGKKGNMDLLVHYAQGAHILQGLPTQVAQYKIKEAKPKHDKFATILRVSLNIHQIPLLESAELQEEWEEDQKIPIKKDVPAAQPKKDAKGDQPDKAADEQMKPEEVKDAPQQEFEIKKKHKKTTVPLEIDTQAHALPPPVRKQFKDLENQLFKEDQEILDHKKYKNELESIAYDIKNNVAQYGPLEKYIDDQTRQQVLQDIEETVGWIYGAGESAPISQFVDRIVKFKKINDPLKERFRFHSDIEVFFQQFANFGQEINERLQAATITDEQRNQILSKYNEMDSYFQSIRKALTEKQPYEDNGFHIDEVHQKLDTFKATVNSLFANPPKPSSQNPSPAPQKEGEDVEMKPADEASGK